jgi:OmpR family response regulator RpaB
MSPREPEIMTETPVRSQTRGRVMVVDDSAAIRRMLAARLRLVGFDVVEAAGGEQALQHFRRQPVPVVITDVSMPGMGGLTVLAELRRDQLAPEVILLTGSDADDGQAAQRARQLGAHAYIPKAPAALEEVALAAERALERWRRRREAPTARRISGNG